MDYKNLEVVERMLLTLENNICEMKVLLKKEMNFFLDIQLHDFKSQERLSDAGIIRYNIKLPYMIKCTLSEHYTYNAADAVWNLVLVLNGGDHLYNCDEGSLEKVIKEYNHFSSGIRG